MTFSTLNMSEMTRDSPMVTIEVVCALSLYRPISHLWNRKNIFASV